MLLQSPPYLHPGSTIGITCPAGFLPVEKAHACMQILERHGFRVKAGATVGSEHFYFSGTDEARCADLQQLLDDPETDAILMGRGGYGLSRIVDELDFTAFVEKPKWIWGFSDITVLHSHIQQQFGIATLHGPMCAAFTPETAQAPHIEATIHALLGKTLHYTLPPHPLNRSGTAQGILTGGNLALLAHLTGSPSQVDTEGKILFIEDIGEYRYNLDRMLLNLKRSGQLRDLAGLLVGDFTDTQDTTRPFGQDVDAIIADKVAAYTYPVLAGISAGHGPINFPLRLGQPAQLTVDETGGAFFNAGAEIVAI
ncbi:MAG: LD-carboxypeptidase [Sphingobacteriales bacterium]|nr:MAG: LD-carboxypeptidase [Sphingobacteriales bacterium]